MKFLLVPIFMIVACAQSLGAIVIFDSINPNASTPIVTIGGTLVAAASYEGVPGGNIGWYYTPTLSANFTYQLTRIDSKFDAWAAPAPPTFPVTISVYSERPVLGGSLLTQGTFNPNMTFGDWQGAELAPLTLLHGTRYFFAFSGLDPTNPVGVTNNAVGVNYGTWDIISGTPTLNNGATTDLGAHYLGTNFATEVLNGFSSGSGGDVRGARNSPIIQFTGNVNAVPEPSSISLVVATLAISISIRNRRSLARRSQTT